jgi:hypothetical protein
LHNIDVLFKEYFEMNEWISVKDRFPEPFVDVLVYCKNRVNGSFDPGEHYFAIDRFCILSDDAVPSFTTTRYFGDVISWMPLPNPPEER